MTYFAINQYTGDLSVLHVLPLIEDFRFQLEITAQASVFIDVWKDSRILILYFVG